MIYSVLNVILNSFLPGLCLAAVMGYSAYFALKEEVPMMLLGSLIFGLGLIHQLAESITWYETGHVPSPGWILGDSVETAVYLLAAVLFLLFTFYYRRTRSLLEEKDLLLDEINHRVKNNLQVIQSLLSIYEKKHQERDLEEILSEISKKIDSFVILYEQLHETGDIRTVNVREYLNDLREELAKTIPEDKAVSLETSLDSVQLPVKKIIACGLIVSELVTNAIEHAFPGDRKGSVEVRFAADDPYLLEVKDTGIGQWDEEPTGKGGGLEIVRSIVQLELQGELRIRSNDGTTVSVTFPTT